jgi:hypothetical protein
VIAERPRPIAVIDTSVFLRDALSSTRRGAASRVLAILPVVAHVVLCEDIRMELVEKVKVYLGWTDADVRAAYGPVFRAARWLLPVPEGPHHLRIVHHDAADTMLVRVAEAVYSDAVDLLAPDQGRFIVTENTRHLPAGTAYAGFLAVTGHGMLTWLEDQGSTAS